MIDTVGKVIEKREIQLKETMNFILEVQILKTQLNMVAWVCLLGGQMFAPV